MPEAGTIMDTLKSATAEQHQAAEHRRLQRDLVAGRISTRVYTDWLGQMLLLHGAVWDGVTGRRQDTPELREVVRDEGRHVANLRADLAALGADPDAVTPLPATARAREAIASAAAADPLTLLGYNYVLEGSMNGNRFIARALGRTLPAPATAYLDPYGEEQRAVWAGYRERMNAQTIEAATADRVIAAARAMFAFITALSDEVLGEPVGT